ncbi:MAG: 16S rRNA (cytosine(1402)-N(4))-methyltransferase RsmH [Crocinitomicaceae bacterium]|nr:16S rRNA (cytosine(1402)-N(4))-methyltransferase RsmH [Crocinitomicaceae bacterium]
MSEQKYHQPVLLAEAIDALKIKPGGVYVDATFGGGGHSREILKYIEEGFLIGIDQDPEARSNSIDDPRFMLVNQNFRYLKNRLRSLGHQQVDGILADLGVSSHQFDSGDRGFSIRFDAPLDMRMDMNRKLTAERVLNTYTEEELVRILREYGEVEKPHKIARTIILDRPIRTSTELMTIIGRFAQRGKEHKFYAQVFQSLRIEVNEELDVLKELLTSAADVLKPGGTLVVISYHSLEDRLVKNFMKTGNFEGKPEKDFFGNLIRPLKMLQNKPVIPGEREISENTRARSAKMRVAEKIEVKY